MWKFCASAASFISLIPQKFKKLEPHLIHTFSRLQTYKILVEQQEMEMMQILSNKQNYTTEP